MNNTELVTKLKTLVHEERKITAEILSSLREVEMRKIYAVMGYPSLFEFCHKELGYSEGAAQRRISAMRLIKELPQIEEKITSGRLSLSVASQVQSFFKKKKSLNKPMATNEKLNLLSFLENASARQCEKTLLKLEPEMATKDKERYVGPETLEIKITVDREFINNLEMLKNQLSHKMPLATTKDILAYALKTLVKDSNFKSGKSSQSTVQPEPICQTADSAFKSANTIIQTTSPAINPPPTSAVEVQEEQQQKNAIRKNSISKASASRYISVYTRRAVWEKGEGKCQYKDPKSGRRCESRKFLEIDHIVPKAYAGTNASENLQLLCDTHNRLKGARL